MVFCDGIKPGELRSPTGSREGQGKKDRLGRGRLAVL